MMKKSYDYPVEVFQKTEITTDIACFIDGYAMALANIMSRLTGESPCGKSYDPMVVKGHEAYSYAFNLKDGGRCHDLTLYENVGEILGDLLKEAIEWVEQGV